MALNPHLDHTTGQIIGDVDTTRRGQVFYDNRRQGPQLRGDNDQDLREQAKAYKAHLRDWFGGQFSWTFPDDSKWELRIYN